MNEGQVIAAVETWIEQAVLGLNLCPFAARPWQKGRVLIVVFNGKEISDLLNKVASELLLLKSQDVSDHETTLVVTPELFSDFYAYLDGLAMTHALLEQMGETKDFQIASFHPQYQFEGTQPDDLENLTNSAPFPIFHLLRQASINDALSRYAEPESIPDRNIQTVQQLSKAQIKKIFPHK